MGSIFRRAFDDPFTLDNPLVTRFLERARNIPGGKIRDTHVEGSRSLSDIGYWYIQYYSGSFAFLQDLRSKFDRGYNLSAAQLAGALNCLVKEAQRAPKALPPINLSAIPPKAPQEPAQPESGARAALARIASPEPAQEAAAPQSAPYVAEPVSPIILDGTYTVVLNESGDYRTLKVATVDPEKSSLRVQPGTQVVSVLSGSDNTADYTGCAFLTGSKAAMWKRFSSDSTLAQAIKILIEANKEARIDMGHAYALASGNCWRCGRKLTVPASINRGLGPVCADKL
jgi:hypothetical protein